MIQDMEKRTENKKFMRASRGYSHCFETTAWQKGNIRRIKENIRREDRRAEAEEAASFMHDSSQRISAGERIQYWERRSITKRAGS